MIRVKVNLSLCFNWTPRHEGYEDQPSGLCRQGIFWSAEQLTVTHEKPMHIPSSQDKKSSLNNLHGSWKYLQFTCTSDL